MDRCTVCGNPATHNEGAVKLVCDACCQHRNAIPRNDAARILLNTIGGLYYHTFNPEVRFTYDYVMALFYGGGRSLSGEDEQKALALLDKFAHTGY